MHSSITLLILLATTLLSRAAWAVPNAPAADLTGSELEKFRCENTLADLAQACAQGQQRDCYRRGLCFQKGWGVESKPGQAVSIFDKACKAGDSYACNALGRMYEEGQGVAKDKAVARLSYVRACELGDAFVCAYLGIRLYDGVLWTPDLVAARSYLERACTAKSERACAELEHHRFYADTKREAELATLIQEAGTAIVASAVGRVHDPKWNAPDPTKDLRASKGQFAQRLGDTPKVLATVVHFESHLTRSGPGYPKLEASALLFPGHKLQWLMDASQQPGRDTRDRLGGDPVTLGHARTLRMSSAWMMRLMRGKCQHPVVELADFSAMPQGHRQYAANTEARWKDACKLMASVKLEPNDYWNHYIRFIGVIVRTDDKTLLLRSGFWFQTGTSLRPVELVEMVDSSQQ